VVLGTTARASVADSVAVYSSPIPRFPSQTPLNVRNLSAGDWHVGGAAFSTGGARIEQSVDLD
jgi:hypothetical protein